MYLWSDIDGSPLTLKHTTYIMYTIGSKCKIKNLTSSLSDLDWCLGSLFLLLRLPVVATQREGFFNKTSYIRLFTPLSLSRHIGLSFRTCEGGQLFQQTSNGNSISLEVRQEGLQFAVSIPPRHFESRISANFLDNNWYTVNILHRLGNLTLSAAGHQVVVANLTYNYEILAQPDLFTEKAVLMVGIGFVGCILEGPSIVFNNSQIQPYNVEWGPCPLATSSCSKVDHCSHEPCMMHGNCVSRPDKYVCHCAARYTGNNCEIDNGSPCLPNPCQNGGVCKEDNVGNFTCQCPSIFSGQLCETEVTSRLCENNPCHNNGTCHTSAGGSRYECTCLPGYTGKDCETNINECQSSPCQHGGTCIDGIDSYTCFCGRTGYTGTNCELNINECENNPCLNRGICFDTYGSYTCQCTTGFGGQNCELNLNECSSGPCLNGGHCEDSVGSYTCHCHSGYTGINCEIDINECDSAVCPANSECIDKLNKHQCVCKPGYAGNPPNCTEADACSSLPCQHGGSCLPHVDGFNCSCPPGYAGALCEHVVDYCISSPCRNGGTCEGDVSSFICDCDSRFTGPRCETLVKCSSNPCQHATSCQDYPGGYYCPCEPGWTGVNCDLDINECQSDPCRYGGTCKDSVNGFYCDCLPGFTGKMCQVNIDECVSIPCLNGGTCNDGVNNYKCNCTEDYMGTNCELEYDACLMNPCFNNGSCVAKSSKKDYYCECLPGFEGTRCENNINECLRVTCPDEKVCIDGINSYECKCPQGYSGDNCTFTGDRCSVNPCLHNGTCKEITGNYTCACHPGYTGRHCESDVNECEQIKNICNNGICLNNEGSFECFCRPGFSGDHCDLDFDECLSHPCYNGATCENKINGFNCICTPGFTGQDCSININECESNPCMNGSTCIDGVATFSCACPLGLTGHLCETNIDDCESSPCLNAGICEDGINSYTCNCSDTGYEGLHCEINIDDCYGDPCTNGAACKDLIKDYQCDCYLGYTGKNCEVDIDECEINPCQFGGACLERSNQSYYESNDSSAVLPEIFKQPFSYDLANGYECVCVPGIIGPNCETNINECDSSPCRSGACKDGVGSYICECEEGFEGVHCEIDINECDRYNPCVHGKCRDQRGPGYICDCPPLFGGMNCSVELTGCKENKCLNGGTCKPYLENETMHRYNCTCPNGFYGISCEQLTTMSLNGNSYVITNTSRDEGYDIHFSFKTTLPDGLLAIGKGSTYYILELVHGKLNLHSSLLNKWEGVFIGSQLNDSNWQKVFVAINASHLVLAANEEQTIYPINLNEGATASHTSFPTTYLGGTIPNLRRLTHGPPSFVGCTQDVYINGQWVLPQNSEGARVSLVNVEVGCPREPKCDPNPCHSGGHCTDLWRDFRCTCERPFLGHTCQYNLTAATFGYENINSSLVTVTVTQQARRAVRNIVDISMFIRTRKSSGSIFYLGSVPGAVPYPEETHIAAQLSGGELQVRIQFNGTPESYTVGGVKLDDGYNHLIQVVRNVTLVQVKINGTEYFRKTISASGQLDFQVLYLGGMPVPANRYKRQVSRPLATDFAANPVGSFKGVIQDVQISNGSQTMVVQFFPLDKKDLQLPPSVGEVSFDTSTVLEGVISDDTCKDEPCNNDGICEVTWNDFTCQCPRGYKGKQCDDMEFCEIQKCPKGSECRNLNHGYECVTNITLPGTSTALQYKYVQGEQSSLLDEISITYRSKTGGLLLYITQDTESVQNYFSISAYKEQITVSWKLTPESPGDVMRLLKEFPGGEWTTISLKIINNVLSGELSSSSTEEPKQMFTPANFSLIDFQLLVASSLLTVGGSEGLSAKHSYVTDGSDNNDVSLTTQDLNVPSSQGVVAYKGCIGEVRIGGILLPFFTSQQLEIRDNNSARDYFELKAKLGPDIELYCVLCFEDECTHGGRCENATTSYKCECTPGYAGDDCSENINECINNECQHNATCIDGLANYTCNCQPGWEGWLCETEIDECLSNPCQNNGTCIDNLGYFECKCTEDYVGDHCEQLRQVTCENQPCKNDAVCKDIKNKETGDNFTCTCTEGFVGVFCDTAYCNVKPCLNNGRCGHYLRPPQCLCLAGYRGNHCEENINECENQPCKNNGKCKDEVDSYTCNCTGTGFSGLNCDDDVDECEDQSANCSLKAKCYNTIGSYTCLCEENMCGDHCNFTDPCKNATPCANAGICEADCKNSSDYTCQCQAGYTGKNCTESSQLGASNVADIALIVGPVIAILLIAGGASLAVFLMMARKKRATRGTYSPSSQEYCNPRVELDNVMKPPPEERLI